MADASDKSQQWSREQLAQIGKAEMADVILRQQEMIRLLMDQVEELKRQVNQNSRNSSKPPSSDGPGAPLVAPKPKSPRSQGAQPGHEAHLRALLPEAEVTRKVPLMPTRCEHCGKPLPEEAAGDPVRHQVWDLPPIEPTVVEYQRYTKLCSCCGKATSAPWPDNMPTSCFGPGVVAVVGILTGVLHVSKRAAEMMMNEVFNVPMSLGGLSACEAQLSEALAKPVEEAREYAQTQDIAYADETGWRLGNRLRAWLWTMATPLVTVFLVHARRGREAAEELLGAFSGTLVSYSGKEEGFQFILDRIAQINRKSGTNYRPTWQVLNAADYGVPQIRVRFILVALRDGTSFRFPPPTHASSDAQSSSLFATDTQPHTTAWDAIGDVSTLPQEKLHLGGKWADLLPSIPEGENYLWHTDRKGGLPLFGWRTRYWCFLLKLAKNLPSWTIQAQPGSAIGPFHWLNRRLSSKEMAAIQTFPSSFCIEGPRVEIQRQIGNAVPSLLAEVLARSIVSQVAGRRFRHPPRLHVPHARSTPPPEPTSSVPQQYLYLVGQHAPHPGTGKGRSYQSRDTCISNRLLSTAHAAP